ncbi:MAG: hypothetical protein HY741_19010 [Chloroflexi bacterium]|nr:hypothetical protein [Chloroflexota bacterium]
MQPIPEINSIADIQTLAVAGFTDWKQYGEVAVRRDGDLLLFDYTAKAQYAARWNFFERVSRGLVVNARTGEIVARPFDKFFNWFEGGRKAHGHIVNVTEKVDGCFRFDTPLQCWDGTTVLIGDVVNSRLSPVLMGMDSMGQIVPCEVIDWFDNGTKDNWLALTVDCPVSKKSGGGRHPNVVRLTDNHHIFINGEFRPASEARVGDSVTTFEYAPAPSVQHVLRSGLLGDGSLTHIHNGYRYQEPHVWRHKDYVETIQRWFGDCATRARTTLSGYGSIMTWAQTKQYPLLGALHQEWYPDGKKCVPEWLDWMDDFSVAKWYMDDGSLSHHPSQQDRALFATHGFEQQDVERLAAQLEKMYGVHCAVYFAKGWALRVNAGRGGEIDVFWSRIAPHVVPCMRYKLPERYRDAAYVEYPSGHQEVYPVAARVISNTPMEINDRNFPAGRVGFDIRTTTGNYFAKGILVHNSLGILYRTPSEERGYNLYRITTRGDFHSPQGAWATQFLNAHYALRDLANELTLLFEIVYPENRIVIDYHGRAALVLLAARNRFTGAYTPFFPDLYELAQKYNFPLPHVYTFNNVTEILERTGTLPVEEEGYVVEFSDGERYKFKGDRYLELHKLISGLSFKHTLEAVQAGTVDYIRAQIPDEYLAELNTWVAQIESIVAATKQNVQAAFDAAPKDSRKDFALWVQQHHKKLASYLFALLDGRDYTPLIYRNEFEEILKAENENPSRATP